MAYIEPNSDLALLHDVPLDPDYENTLYFDNISQQTNYFLAKRVHTFSKLSYVRRNRGWIRLGWNADQWPNNTIIQKLYDSTYMMFKNTNFENKWFYAFVDKVEYVNNNTVDVQYHIDVLQTWHFDYILNECFIERQHTIGDTPGVNTLPEQLETGPYMSTIPEFAVDGNIISDGLMPYTPKICLVTTFDGSGDYAEGYLAPGLKSRGDYFTGVNYYLYNITQQGIQSLNDTLEYITQSQPLKDGVISLLMVPGDFFDVSAPTAKKIYFPNPTKLGNYTPRNKKLLCYPYNYFYVYNNSGNGAEYHYENFAPATRIALQVWGNISANPGLICSPYDYKNISGVNYEEKLTLSGFPMCSWSYDAFKAWLAQNAGSIAGSAIGLAGSWLMALESPATLANRGPDLVSQTAGALGSLYDHSRRPPQSAGDTNGDLTYQAGLCTFMFMQKHIKPEYARVIDAYFDMYGYAYKRSGVPNRNARRCYTYVKTIGCSIHGDFPAEDILKIQTIFNKGVRFWRTTAVFGSYDPSVNDNRV